MNVIVQMKKITYFFTALQTGQAGTQLFTYCSPVWYQRKLQHTTSSNLNPITKQPCYCHC